jgi:hypothetical protein
MLDPITTKRTTPIDSVSPLQTESSSYIVYEPLTCGPYTLYIWRITPVQSNNRNNINNTNNFITHETSSIILQPKTSLVYKSYLPFLSAQPVFNYNPKTTTTSKTETQSSPILGINGKLQRTRATKSAPALYLPDYSLNRAESSESVWQMNIYKSGQYTDPSDDRLLEKCRWATTPAAKRDDWMNLTFSRKELCNLIADIFNLWEDKCVKEEEVSRWITEKDQEECEQIWS